MASAPSSSEEAFAKLSLCNAWREAVSQTIHIPVCSDRRQVPGRQPDSTPMRLRLSRKLLRYHEWVSENLN